MMNTFTFNQHIVTARKRSFYTCLLVILFTEGGEVCMARMYIVGGHVWKGGICVLWGGGGGIHAGETAIEVGNTHPTGMHSCYE